MINSEEIRLSNWVSENGKPVQVDAFDYYGALMAEDRSYDDGYRTIKDPEGIPLTDGLLSNLGYIRDNQHECFVLWQSDCGVAIEFYDNGIHLIGHTMADELSHVKYLHQLQNLLFALSGKEININL